MSQKYSMHDSIASFLELIRYWDWCGKVQSIALASLLLMLFAENGTNQALNVTVFIIYLYFAFIFGYMLNDYADKEIDVPVGKYRGAHFSKKFILTIIFVTGLLTAGVPFYFKNSGIIALGIIGLLLAITYSVKPVRLKEKGVLGLLVSSIAQRLPFAIFFFLLPNEISLVAFLLGWLLLIGFIIEAGFQLSDIKNDTKTHTNTFATAKGSKKMVRLIHITTIILVAYTSFPIVYIWRDALVSSIFFSLILFLFSHFPIHSAYVNMKSNLTD